LVLKPTYLGAVVSASKTYGHFDDEAREFVITDPDTPWPWINYLGREDFFSLISNTGGGYCFHQDALYRRLLRFRYNNVPADTGGRAFFIRNEGDVWSPAWKPVKAALSEYECRHGMGYTRIRGARGGVRAEITSFVPLGANCEIHLVSVTNTSGSAASVSLWSYVEWCLWNANDDATNFQRNLSIGEVEVDGDCIYHVTGFRERRTHYAFYSCSRDVAGFDTDRDAFLGRNRGLHEPVVPQTGRSTNSVASGWSPIASHMVKLDLAAGETEEIVFVLGYVEVSEAEKWEAPGRVNKIPARQLHEQFGSPDAARAALAELACTWTDSLARFQIVHEDHRLQRQVNVWNQYQCVVTYNLARSASYFESGIGRGLGFRDTCQDLLGCVHLDADRARSRILDVAATQLPDGGAYHQYQPLTKRGNYQVGGDFNDDPLWLIAAVGAYIRETGRWDVLDIDVPFDNDPEQAGTLFNHLKRSIDHVLQNLGPHGLPLIGRADWNDCLNLNAFSTDPNESFQTTANRTDGEAESVFIAAMFVLYGRDYAEMCLRTGNVGEAERVKTAISSMDDAIIAHGWDGEWFRRAYDYFGNPVGSQANTEGRIFIEPQGMCAMAGIGDDDGLPLRALDSVRTHLDSEHGILLLQPAYSSYQIHLGEISTYPPGYKENSGVFCHNNPWVVIGETRNRRGDRAFEYYRKTAPAYIENQDLHRTEPYVYPQMIAGKDAPNHGEAKNSWLTGTAAWNFVAISQYILGIRPHWDGMVIDPCIPSEWDGYRVRRVFRDATLEITVSNPNHVSAGIARLTVDGEPVTGNLIRIEPGDARTRTIDVVLG